MRTTVAAAFALAAATASAAQAGSGGALLRYLADDTSFVVVVDVAHARKTPTLQHALEYARGKLATWQELAQAGVDPLALADTIVVAGTGPLSANDHHLVAIVDGRVDKLAAALERTGKRAGARAGVDMWAIPGAELAVLDHRLIVTAPGGLVAVIDRARGKSRGSGPTAIRELVAAVGGGTDLVAGIALDDPGRHQLGTVLGGEPRWVGASLAAASQLVVQVVLELGDDTAAAKVRDVVASKLSDPSTHGELEGIGKGFSDSLLVDQQHSQVRLSASLTADEADKLVALLKVAM